MLLEIEGEERPLVHLVWFVGIREEPSFFAVCQDGQSRFGNMKIAEQLAELCVAQLAVDRLGLNQHGDLTVDFDREIDFLTLLRAHVGDELRQDLFEVEDVESQRLNEGKNNGGFCGFLGKFLALRSLGPAGKRVNSLEEFVHNPLQLPSIRAIALAWSRFAKEV